MKINSVFISTLLLSNWVTILALEGPADDAPHGLMVEFLRQPENAVIADSKPEFCWVVHSSHQNDVQTAYCLLVSSGLDKLAQNQGDLWDSGKIKTDQSINVEYQGKPLAPNHEYYWKVKTWCKKAGESPWPEAQKFTTAAELGGYATSRNALSRTKIAPRSLVKKGDGHYLIDFGKVAFGYLQATLSSPTGKHPIEIHFGERGDANGINRHPGGTVRYYCVPETLREGTHSYEIHPPQDKRNTSGEAILLPAEIGVIAPFRYVELEGAPDEPDTSLIRQVAIHYPFDETASAFSSSNQVLNDVWALCKYSMKATSFAGVYVDGDRERIPYEADAYINQLSHYAVDREYALARYSHEYLLRHPTWPTEWKQHSVLMAWADYMYTGNTESLAENYNLLKAEKTLEKYAREDGLLNTKGLRDIVDWPAGERDDYDFKEVNTVVNAFYYQTLLQMADIATALDKGGDAAEYRQKAARVKTVFNRVFWNTQRGIYVDGEGSTHSSLHANMMPLAFGLVPPEKQQDVTDFVISRGMACSVYGAQYLLEALYHAGRPAAALALLTSQNLRSWYNMLRLGSTITLEAWDEKFKPNLDWNHAWGTAPGNIIARYVMGVRPLEPGFSKVLIQPQPASLQHASATIPTIRGPVRVSFQNPPAGPFVLDLDIPVNMTVRVGIPIAEESNAMLSVDGNPIPGQIEGKFLLVDGIGSGRHVIAKK